MSNHLKLKRVKFKNGGTIEVFPKPKSSIARMPLGDWGEVTFTCFDGDYITNETINYMLDCAKQANFVGLAERFRK